MKKFQKNRNYRRRTRTNRVRVKIRGTAKKPRAAIFRSLGHIYVQIIDDTAGKTLIAASDTEIKGKKGKKKTAIAKEVGELVASKALVKKVNTIVFDRRGCKYHGRVKAVAEGMREKGLKF
ncbi:50S ribosomal protein L18 [Patescibacteria group bacterium]|nr:50S ribosomal protein L18 [Patescibacteria group bacterium]MBU0963966.1 50S ribosomal protein L18 [Patescibacteria group bacterium]